MLAGLLGDLRTTMTAGAAARPREALIARYESYLEHDPHNEALLVALGDLHHESKAFEKALEFYRRCLARNPAHLGAQSRMANVLISQHRFAQAQAMPEALRATYPDEPALCFNLGRSLLDHLQAYVRAQAARAEENAASLPPGREP